MQSLEQRVAYLEGKMEDQQTSMTDLRTDLRDFRADVTREFSEFRIEMLGLRGEMRTGFMWIMGTQFAVLLSIIGGLIGAYLRAS